MKLEQFYLSSTSTESSRFSLGSYTGIIYFIHNYFTIYYLVFQSISFSKPRLLLKNFSKCGLQNLIYLFETINLKLGQLFQGFWSGRWITVWRNRHCYLHQHKQKLIPGHTHFTLVLYHFTIVFLARIRKTTILFNFCKYNTTTWFMHDT